MRYKRAAEVLVIDEEKMQELVQSSYGLHGLMKRQDNLVKHAETLETRINEDTENLDYTRSEISITQIGILWAKKKMLEELEAFIYGHVNGIHLDVIEALQEHNEATGAPMTASDLKDKVLAQDDGTNDLSLTSVVQDLVSAGLLIRGGKDHAPGLRGKLWTSVYDLRTEITKEEETLEKAGTLTVPTPPRYSEGDNVVALRPNGS